MTLLDFVRFTRANLLRLVIAALLGAGIALGYAMTLPKVYVADASGFVQASPERQTSGEVWTSNALAGSRADAYRYLVSSRAVAAVVIAELGLAASPAEVAARVSATVEQGSNIIKVTATGPTPRQARDVADATVRATAQEANRIELGDAARPGAQPLVKIVPVESALLPAAPVAPNLPKYGLAGGLAGLGAMYVLLLGRRLLDTRVRSVRDVEEQSGVPVLGIIAQAPELKTGAGSAGTNSLGIAGEGFRQLRTNLRFVSVDHPPRSIVVTSPAPGEGKSTVSATLARVLGAAGQATVIVDADLRRPALAGIFERDGTLGLSQVLSGQLSLADALQQTGHPNVQFIPAGRIPPNPSELLGSHRMRLLIDELAADHLVIMDAPPLLPVTDAGLLAAGSDGAILVLRVGRTHKEQLAFCAKVLRQVGGTTLGAVLNFAPKKAMGQIAYGDGYGRGRGYGYGYGYDATSAADSARDRAESAADVRPTSTP